MAKKMTEKQLDRRLFAHIKEHCISLGRAVRLHDGQHYVTIRKVMRTDTVAVYEVSSVDGWTAGVWGDRESEIGAKYWCPKYETLPRWYKDVYGKRKADAERKRLTEAKRVLYYYPSFATWNKLVKHYEGRGWRWCPNNFDVQPEWTDDRSWENLMLAVEVEGKEFEAAQAKMHAAIDEERRKFEARRKQRQEAREAQE